MGGPSLARYHRGGRAGQRSLEKRAAAAAQELPGSEHRQTPGIILTLDQMTSPIMLPAATTVHLAFRGDPRVLARSRAEAVLDVLRDKGFLRDDVPHELLRRGFCAGWDLDGSPTGAPLSRL